MNAIMLKSFLVVLMTASCVSAQDVQSQREDLEQRLKAEEQIRRAAEEAKKAELKGPVEDVTYQDVMKDPDNIELNFRYARLQVARNELIKAAGTLERILMVNPELPKVRLFYAMVLFRLDNLDDAERELRVLGRQKLTESMRAELEVYVKEIGRRRRKGHATLTLSAGVDYDENRNSAPATGRRLLADVETILNSDSTRVSDVAKTMSAALNGSYDLGYQAGHTVFAALSYYRAEQTTVKTLNLQSFNWSAGATFKSPWVNITGEADFGHLFLAESTYQRTHGATLTFDRKIGERATIFGSAAYQRQIYSRTEVVPAADERTGDSVAGTLGVSLPLSRTISFSGQYTHTSQGAREPYNAYDRETFNLGLTKTMRGGRFVQLALTPQLDFYDGPETAISAKTRQDNTYRIRLTFGTPLTFIADPMRDFLFTISHEYFHSFSNIMNYGYTNNKISSSLTYRFSL